MVKPLIVILCLEDYSLQLSFNIHRHLLSTLPNKAEVRQAKTAAQARRYLTSTVRPHSIVVIDSALAHPWYRDIRWLLGNYVKAGGTAIFSGLFISTIPDMSFDEIWRDVFLLRWRACFADRGSEYVLNTHVKGLDPAELPAGYTPSSRNATWINGVSPEHSLYVSREELKKLEKGKGGQMSQGAMVKTTVAFAAHKKGHVGYVGDMNFEGSQDAAQIIIDMCFYPSAQAPTAPGTGGPPVPIGATSTDEALAQRNILFVSLEKEDWSDETYAQLHNALRINANVTEVQTAGAVSAALAATPRPDAVIISDGAISHVEHSRVLDKLVEYACAGGTVVLGMHFSNHFPLGTGRTFFGAWGLPWDQGSYHRTTFAVNPDGVPAPLDAATLVPSFSMKALHVKGAAREHAVYLPTADSRVQSLVFAPQPIAGELAQESPAVFAPVGTGYLGYVGDVNGEQGSTRVIIEICGVKIKPGDMGARRLLKSVTMHPDGTSEAVRETEEEVPLPVPARPPPPPRAPRARDEEVEGWNNMRRMDREQMVEEAEREKIEGNDLFRAGQWTAAAEKYRDAIMCRGPQPVYLANLAAALLRLELYEIADSAVSRAIMHDPKHVKALYRRALARNALGRHNAAMHDITRLLVLEPTSRSALDEYRRTVTLEGRAPGNVNWPGDEQLLLKQPTDIELPLDIDDSDCDPFSALTVGNGEQCRAWNHDGCRRAENCMFQHAPDGLSVRDELRRNVCLSWLLGECRFGDECAYSHDKEYLPSQGWWTDDARLSRLRQEFHFAVGEAPLDFGDGPVSECILAEALKPLHWQFDLWFTAEYERDTDDRMYNEPPSAQLEDDEPEWMDTEEANLGAEAFEEEFLEPANDYEWHADDAVQEMLMYGIKPYDEGAWDELAEIQRITGSGRRC